MESNSDPLKKRNLSLLKALQWLFFAAICAIPVLLFKNSQLNWDWRSVAEYHRIFIEGWRNTLLLSLAGLAGSLSVGLILLLFSHQTAFPPLRFLARTYTEIVRGTPFLAQIYIFFYILADALRLHDRFLCGVLVLSFFAGAYIGEILRAGVASVPATQIESAKAIGLTPWQTFRYITLPQATRSILPPLTGQFVSLIKDSSLLSIIGIPEFTQGAKNVSSYTFSNFESYIILAIGYLIITLPISLVARHLEKRFRYES